MEDDKQEKEVLICSTGDFNNPEDIDNAYFNHAGSKFSEDHLNELEMSFRRFSQKD